jgi:hypothetical protein
VGKTSTAECVAEYTGRPLLAITCGDIGDEAGEVQENLEYNLSLAHRWGCVMLLDEADVYLVARNKMLDLKRNAVVSVFLRVLEYYSGILFLTTNKVGMIDEAFKSRIHLSLHYPALDLDQNILIWELNLEHIKKMKPRLDFSKDDLIRWAERHWRRSKLPERPPWNGRQIRNAVQIAAALAEFGNDGTKEKRSRITCVQLDAVARANQDFDDYLRLFSGSDAAEAKRNMERNDEYQEGRRQYAKEDLDYGYDDDWVPRREVQRAGRRKSYAPKYSSRYDPEDEQEDDYARPVRPARPAHRRSRHPPEDYNEDDSRERRGVNSRSRAEERGLEQERYDARGSEKVRGDARAGSERERGFRD